MLHSEQPQTLLKTMSPAVSTGDEGLVKTMQWYITSPADDMDHLPKELPGAEPEAAS